ncbi:hypothetical protein IKX73_00325 [Candidatus Saccharibacteria bacterium]|nr:hypothetical protein [Candidatus Saccharibacteria bacterium]
MTKGGRNLAILGIVSVIVAFATTSVSLALYHNSGDIYLDRSRPGYLPDEEESSDDTQEEVPEFEKSGKLTVDVLEEYLKLFEKELNAVDAYENPFSAEALSDAKLGISAE